MTNDEGNQNEEAQTEATSPSDFVIDSSFELRHFPDRLTERSDLIFLMRRGHGNAQSRGALGHGGIANCWNEKSFTFQRTR
jgi:hypothetical protein